MAPKTKTRNVTITHNNGTFSTLFKRFSGEKNEYDFEGLSTLRKLLSNEKARLLHFIKKKNPGSIYELAKGLNRDFKSVSEDVKILRNFGFIDLISEQKNGRKKLKPILDVDKMFIEIRI